MNLSINEEQQQEMCHAYYDGAPGVLVSGLVWLFSTIVCYLIGINQAVWTLLIGGSLIYPISAIVTKAIWRPAKTSKANALNQLAAASTIWLILSCGMSYGLFLFMPVLFFPAMMVTIGSRYLVFASIYGKSIFWVMGGSLIIGGMAALSFAILPVFAAGIGAMIEVLFAFVMFLKVAKSTI